LLFCSVPFCAVLSSPFFLKFWVLNLDLKLLEYLLWAWTSIIFVNSVFPSQWYLCSIFTSWNFSCFGFLTLATFFKFCLATWFCFYHLLFSFSIFLPSFATSSSSSWQYKIVPYNLCTISSLLSINISTILASLFWLYVKF